MKKAIALAVITATLALAQLPKPGGGSGGGGGGSGTVGPGTEGAMAKFATTTTIGDATPGTDYVVSLTGGTGITCSGADGVITCSKDGAVVATHLVGSGAPSANCTQGFFFYTNSANGDYYRCSATDTWTIATVLTSYVTFQAGICQNTTAGTNFSLPAANLPAATCITGSNINTAELLFDAGTDESMQSWLRLPTGWTGAIDFALKWRAAATSGNVVWGLQTICVADAETSDPAFNTANTITDAAKGTTLQENDASTTGITTTGCAAGERMFFKVYRDADNGSDTMSGDAGLLSVTFTLRRTI